MIDQEAVLAWMTERFRSADIVKEYFAAKDGGRAGPDDIGAIFNLSEKLMMGSCGFLSSTIARQVGSDQLVWLFSRSTGRLLHSVIACSPQYDPELLRGDYVDILGRSSFSELLSAMERIAGPLVVEIGGPIDREDYSEGQEAELEVLARALPWTRQFMGRPPAGAEPVDFVSAIRLAGSGSAAVAACADRAPRARA